MSNSLRPPGLQHTSLPCPSLSPGVCSDSCLLSQWRYLTISSSATSFSFGPQSFLASRSFPMSRLFASHGQSIGASASASVLPMNIQGWFPFRSSGLISLQSKRLSSLLQHHNLKASILRCLTIPFCPHISSCDIYHNVLYLCVIFLTKLWTWGSYCRHSINVEWNMNV